MSESSFSFTTKINGVDLFTVRGDTYEEYLNNLTQVYNVPAVRNLLDILNGMSEAEAIKAIQDVFDAPAVVTPVVSVPATVNVGSTSVPGGKTCKHGTMFAKQGTGRDGKIWRGYMCPSDKGATDKCKNIYIYPNMPEWHTFVAS